MLMNRTFCHSELEILKGGGVYGDAVSIYLFICYVIMSLTPVWDTYINTCMRTGLGIIYSINAITLCMYILAQNTGIGLRGDEGT